MALTQITDTWYNVDGSPFNGTLVITPQPAPGAIVYADTQSVGLSTITVQVVNGLVNFSLQANDVAQPSGTSYSVLVYAGRGKSWTETWTVPSSTAPVALATVRGLAQGLRLAAFFPQSLTWTLPASQYNIASNIPLVLLYDQFGNQMLSNIVRNLSTGDTTVNFAVPQMGTAEVLLTPKQYTQTFTSQTSLTISATTAGLSNLIAAAVLDTTGLYIFEGVSVTFSITSVDPQHQSQSGFGAAAGGNVPFGSNFAGLFQSVTLEFVIPQSGTVVLLGS